MFREPLIIQNVPSIDFEPDPSINGILITVSKKYVLDSFIICTGDGKEYLYDDIKDDLSRILNRVISNNQMVFFDILSPTIPFELREVIKLLVDYGIRVGVYSFNLDILKEIKSIFREQVLTFVTLSFYTSDIDIMVTLLSLNRTDGLIVPKDMLRYIQTGFISDLSNDFYIGISGLKSREEIINIPTVDFVIID